LSRDDSSRGSDRTVSVTALAEALADRIGGIVPDEADVSVDGTAVCVRFRRTPESIDIEPIVDSRGTQRITSRRRP
jgi:hypothetical protein